MIKFSKEKVLLLHKLIAEETGGRLDCTNEEVAEVGLSVADGTMSYEMLREWVIAHRV